MDKREFINSIKEGALKGQTEHNIVPSLTIAQAILESGWGSSELSQRANNLFGIKASSGWKGKRITMPTIEWFNDQRQVVNADFRVYDTFNDSIEDHNKLLSTNRYKPVRECFYYKEACEKIYKCDYATDPVYPAKLIKIIEEYKLYEFDSAPVIDEAAVSSVNDKILKFQQMCNKLGIKDDAGKALVEDNILGPRSRSCIAKLPTLKLGSSGKAVRFVQEVVNAVPVDGDFGPITRNCVIEYQRSKNIAVDGIVGQETWRVIVTL